MRYWRSFLFIMTFILIMLIGAACDDSNDEAPTDPTEALDDLGTFTDPETGDPLRSSTLDIVLERGVLRCGVQSTLPGFSYQTEDGNFLGFDTDLCRALAAALFGDASRVEFVALTTAERFPALTEREIDVLIRNTTWTLTRDTTLQTDFGPVVFYDGQGILVRADSSIFTLDDLDGQRICVQPETTTQINLDDTLESLDMTYSLISIEDLPLGMDNLAEEVCDAFTTDRSGLVSLLSNTETPSDYRLLDVVLSQEPLAPVYRENDSEWGNLINWTIYGMIHAERLGITQANIDDSFGLGIPEIEFLLGETGEAGEALGVSNDFMANVIREVGNYGEIYARNLGEDSDIQLPRGQNALWIQGGLVYAPPFR